MWRRSRVMGWKDDGGAIHDRRVPPGVVSALLDRRLVRVRLARKQMGVSRPFAACARQLLVRESRRAAVHDLE